MRVPALRSSPAAALFAAALLALALGLAARPAAAAGEEVTVSIDNFTFTPAEVTVAPGTTVTWVNNDDIPHTVVDKKQAFRSKVLDTEGKYSFTFNTAGDFTYFCSLHPHMTGKVVVKPAG
ncbi:blue (type 1) copper domain protein [Xanthobacter versatilis]|uniref:Blue (Type 1) copper domain protein n=1 Tax=Xanthobacter autotrophicus (strain ATCC BAA-1158 / Py2) TaxID=78245 RepID=A7IDY3_XANP2|nr:blue (type 1) copper domain protein [Xanthobacter autotrophicus Py2]